MMDVTARRAAFRKLHHSGCFVAPNPWNAGTARYLRHLGFPAFASTSAGFSFRQGLPDEDGVVALDEVLAYLAEIVEATELPVTADFGTGYAHEPEGIADSVRRCIATGVAGLSIADCSDDRDKPLYDLPFAVERIRAARAAIVESGADVLLTAGAECYLVGEEEPLRGAIRRLQAYAEAGADVLCAPGPRKREDLQAIVDAVAPKPVNVLMSSNVGLKVADLAEIGVRRVCIGSALARTAWAAFIRAANILAEEGSFAGFDGSVSFAELNGFFREDLAERRR